MGFVFTFDCMKKLSGRTIFAGGFLVVLVVGVAAFFWLFHDLPDLDQLPAHLHIPSVRIVDRNGRLLYEAIDPGGGRHTVIPLEKIPLACRQATIATEDSRFYTNPGFDVRGMIRAVWINLRGGQTIAGGSTITQQVARSLLLDSGERTIQRKLREILLAWELTRRFTKDEILSLYLNQVYYGGMSYGIEAASQTYFGKPAEALGVAECALIAGIPQVPSLYNPFTDFEASKHRQEIVLSLMEKSGYLTLEQTQLASLEKLVLASTPFPIEAPHFVMMVRNKLDALYSQEEIFQLGGLTVRTSLDLDWQKHAEDALRGQLEILSRTSNSLGHNVNNAALVAIDPANGDVLALVGSPDYFDPEHGGAINMAISARQPGSALKPLIYAAALDPNNPTGGWTAATMILDVSTSFLTHDGKAYIPANYDLKENGPVLVREALASSLNIPAVKALEHIGIPGLFDIASKMGVSILGNPQDYDLSLALGGGAVRLLDLTAAYSVFANKGFRVDPHLILDIQDGVGRSVYTSQEPTRVRVLDPRIAWLISDILSDNDARRAGFGENSILRLDRPAAVKTGTTSNFHDNWTIGYTPDLVVGVWSGNTDYQPMRDINGLTGAAPIWHEFLRTVSAGTPREDFTMPPGLIQEEICALSGLLPRPACQYRRLEWFLDGTQPTELDNLYKEVLLDRTIGQLANLETPKERLEKKIALDLPLEAQSWAQSRGIILYDDFLKSQLINANSPLAGASPPDTALIQLVSPSNGSTYRIAPGFSSKAQKIQLHASFHPDITRISFWVDGIQIQSASGDPSDAWWELAPGDHRAWVEGRNASGRLISSQVVLFSVIQ